MNRVADYFDRSPADCVREAARDLERDYAQAVREASAGVPFDVDDLMAMGAKCGRTPFHTWADVKIASAAYDAWLHSVPMLTS